MKPLGKEEPEGSLLGLGKKTHMSPDPESTLTKYSHTHKKNVPRMLSEMYKIKNNASVSICTHSRFSAVSVILQHQIQDRTTESELEEMTD